MAHAIRGVPDPPPVTLLCHRPTLKEDFEKAGNIIKLRTGRHVEEQSGYDVELVHPTRWDSGVAHGALFEHERSVGVGNEELIFSLVVTVKAPDTVAALKPILHRLSSASTILFLQNGMGATEECAEKLFLDPLKRPSCMVGVNSHGVHATSSVAATHAGLGTIMLGLLPRVPSKDTHCRHVVNDGNYGWNTSSRYLLRTLTRVPLLAAVALSPIELQLAQLEKLAINCLINPLTVLLDCRNGDMLNNFAVSRTMLLLLAEISLVLQSLPELQGLPNLKLRFSPERLQHLAVGVAHKTADNISSMLQDVRRGARTEVEYMNGYIVKRGEELGIKPVMNYMLMQMVIGKQQMISRETDKYLPTGNRPHSRP